MTDNIALTITVPMWFVYALVTVLSIAGYWVIVMVAFIRPVQEWSLTSEVIPLILLTGLFVWALASLWLGNLI